MKTLTMLAVLGLATVGGFAADYTTMSITELQALRGTVAVEDRAAYQAEMKSRVASMTPEELTTFKETVKQNPVGTQTGAGLKTQTRTQMGTQMGTMGTQMGTMGGQMSMGGGRFR